MSPRLDAHQHFWRLDQGEYAWIDRADPVLCRDYIPDDLAPLLDLAGIQRTIVVQAESTVAETRRLLALAEATPFIAGVVGWVDLLAPEDTLVETLSELCQSPYLVGIRPTLPRRPEYTATLSPLQIRNLRNVADRNLCIDWLVTLQQLPIIADAMERVPGLTAVVDHLGQASEVTASWSSTMCKLAQFPTCYCKVSGIATLGGEDKHSEDTLHTVVEHVWDAFGPERLLFGSDWPVCLTAGTSYHGVVELTQHVLPKLSADETAAVFGGSAIRCYGLSEVNRV